MFERYFVMTHGKRRRRYWREVAAYGEAVPPKFLELAQAPDSVIDVSHDECMAFDAWCQSVGLGEPPVTLIDREDQRPQAKAFAEKMALAMASYYVDKALREVLLSNDCTLTIEPDPEDEDLWHCRVGDSEWAWTGKTPIDALKVALDDTARSMLDRAPSE